MLVVMETVPEAMVELDHLAVLDTTLVTGVEVGTGGDVTSVVVAEVGLAVLEMALLDNTLVLLELDSVALLTVVELATEVLLAVELALEVLLLVELDVVELALVVLLVVVELALVVELDEDLVDEAVVLVVVGTGLQPYLRASATCWLKFLPLTTLAAAVSRSQTEMPPQLGVLVLYLHTNSLTLSGEM